MTEKTIISKYNNLHNKKVESAALRALCADAVALSKKAKASAAIKTVANKLTKAVKQINGHPVAVIQIDKKVTLPKVAKRKPKATKLKKSPTLNGVDESLLCGLECIEDDSDLGEVTTLSGTKSVYDFITERIAKKIKKDGLYWRKKWKQSSLLNIDGINYSTKKYYNGINWFLLVGQMREHDSPYFLTMKQANRIGGKIKKGSEAYPVVYYSKIYRDENGKLLTKEEARELKIAKGAKAVTEYFALKYYKVFNSEDIEGVDFGLPKEDLTQKADFQDIKVAEDIVSRMPKRPVIYHKGSKAFYKPSTDSVTMPKKTQFETEAAYYSTLFHELVHSTKHKSRVGGRDLKRGERNYAFEELIAEIGATFLNAQAGIMYYNLQNSAAYIKHWKSEIIAAMENDSKFIFRAAAQAQKATDFILAGKDYRITELQKSTKKSSDRKPVTRKSKIKNQKSEQLELSLNGLNGFTRADQQPEAPKGQLFTLPGAVGEWLGEQQQYRLVISLDGETHAGKSELAKQIVNGFAAKGYTIAWLDLEQGGLESKDTRASFERNVSKDNMQRVFVSGEAASINTLDQLASNDNIDVIAIDSGSKVATNDFTNGWIEQLRVKHPNKIWVVIWQQNAKGGTRGGSSVNFDAPVHIKAYRPDHSDYNKNYAVFLKNRGNATDKQYMIAAKKIVDINQQDDE